jgi:transcriptional regulator with XRE-family HTH domain
VEPDEERRRLRAARAYADFSLDELAERVQLGRSTLIRVDNGERNLKDMEKVAIARACGLPEAFFTADFARLAELPPSLEERLAAIEAAVLPLSGLEQDLAETLGRLRPPSDGPTEAEERGPRRSQAG